MSILTAGGTEPHLNFRNLLFVYSLRLAAEAENEKILSRVS